MNNIQRDYCTALQKSEIEQISLGRQPIFETLYTSASVSVPNNDGFITSLVNRSGNQMGPETTKNKF
jgi:hypothetical protein